MATKVFTFQARALDGLTNESGALTYVVRKGTTTPIIAYTDSGLTTPATNPQVANSLGLVGPLYWNDSVEAEVTFRVKTNDAATVLLQVDYAGGAFSASYIQVGQLTKFNATYTSDGAQTKALTGKVVSSPYGLNVYFDGIIQPKDNYTVTTNGTDSTITWATSCQPASGVTVYYEAAVLEALSPAATDYAGVDVSAAVVTPTGGTTARSLAARFAEFANVLDFGAVGDGVTNDTTALAAAIATGKDVYLPSGYAFLVSTDSLTMATTGQAMFGPMRASSTPSAERPCIKFTATTGNIILVTADIVTITGIQFQGPGRSSSATAIKGAKVSNTDDIDIDVFDNGFTDVQTCIDVVGRGCDVENNQFGSCDIAVTRSWPASGTSGTGLQALPYGFRKDQIRNNHFHEVNTPLASTGADAIYYRVAFHDNESDSGDRLFYGWCTHSSFVGNKIEHSSGTPLNFRGDTDHTLVSGNFIAGESAEPTASPGYLIRVEGDWTNGNIVGNIMAYADIHGVFVEGDLIDSNIKDNVIDTVGQEAGDNRAAVAVAGAITRSAIEGNNCDLAADKRPVYCEGAVTDSRIVNVYNPERGLPLWGTWTDGGGNVIGGAALPNSLINGDFSLAQRGTAFTSASTTVNNDDTYLLDRWYILTDGNDVIDVSRQTSSTHIPGGALYAISLDVETANKKFGIAQIVSAADSRGLTGKRVTVHLKAKKRSGNATAETLKIGVVAWSGTADSVTSDIVSAWEAGGTTPTLIANATFENTPAAITLTTSYVWYSATALIDTASTANVLVFIWCDDADATVGDFIDIAEVHLSPAPYPTLFPAANDIAERHRAAYFFERINANATDPIGGGLCYSTTKCAVMVNCLPKRVQPAVTTSTASGFSLLHGSATTTAATNLDNAIQNLAPFDRFTLDATVAAGLTGGAYGILRANTSNTYIDISAEL